MLPKSRKNPYLVFVEELARSQDPILWTLQCCHDLSERYRRRGEEEAFLRYEGVALVIIGGLRLNSPETDVQEETENMHEKQAMMEHQECQELQMYQSIPEQYRSSVFTWRRPAVDNGTTWRESFLFSQNSQRRQSRRHQLKLRIPPNGHAAQHR